MPAEGNQAQVRQQRAAGRRQQGAGLLFWRRCRGSGTGMLPSGRKPPWCFSPSKRLIFWSRKLAKDIPLGGPVQDCVDYPLRIRHSFHCLPC